MKSVAISCAILMLSILLLVLNTVVVSNITDNIMTHTNMLPDYIPPSGYEEELGSGKLDFIVNYFIKNEFFLSLTTNLQEIQNIKSSLLSMREFYRNGNQAHYLAARAVFVMYVERWHKNELPHADNIF